MSREKRSCVMRQPVFFFCTRVIKAKISYIDSTIPPFPKSEFSSLYHHLCVHSPIGFLMTWLKTKTCFGSSSRLEINIMQPSPCNLYPLTPHFYIVKLGLTGVYIIFLFLL